MRSVGSRGSHPRQAIGLQFFRKNLKSIYLKKLKQIWAWSTAIFEFLYRSLKRSNYLCSTVLGAYVLILFDFETLLERLWRTRTETYLIFYLCAVPYTDVCTSSLFFILYIKYRNYHNHLHNIMLNVPSFYQLTVPLQLFMFLFPTNALTPPSLFTSNFYSKYVFSSFTEPIARRLLAAPNQPRTYLHPFPCFQPPTVLQLVRMAILQLKQFLLMVLQIKPWSEGIPGSQFIQFMVNFHLCFSEELGLENQWSEEMTNNFRTSIRMEVMCQRVQIIYEMFCVFSAPSF